MFDVPNTAANAATAAAVNARLEADARLNRAKARTWILAGVGGLLALVGIGTGAVIAAVQSRIGYVEGKVQLDNPPPLKLDTNGATVKLDATGASVRVAGGNSFPNAPTTQPQSGGKVVVDYTIFHTVDFAGGEVQTGWKYQSSQDAAPSWQYCMFRMPTDPTGARSTWDIASDGKPVPLPANVPFNVSAALRNCVWFQ